MPKAKPEIAVCRALAHRLDGDLGRGLFQHRSPGVHRVRRGRHGQLPVRVCAGLHGLAGRHTGRRTMCRVVREGGDGADGTPETGRGWAKLRDGELHGPIAIHLGDESGFVAERAKLVRPKAKKRK